MHRQCKYALVFSCNVTNSVISKWVMIERVCETNGNATGTSGVYTHIQMGLNSTQVVSFP